MAPSDASNYVGFWHRLSASFWDTLIIGIPLSIVQYALAFLVSPLAGNLVGLLWIAIVVYFEGIKGATPGKMIVGIAVRNDKNAIIGVPSAILRYVGKIISSIILGIGFLMIAWDAKKQGLHDKIAGTFVVKTADRKGMMIVGLVLGAVIIVLAIIFFIAFVLIAMLAITSNAIPAVTETA